MMHTSLDQKVDTVLEWLFNSLFWPMDFFDWITPGWLKWIGRLAGFCATLAWLCVWILPFLVLYLIFAVLKLMVM